jgi:hypothetical protein
MAVPGRRRSGLHEALVADQLAFLRRHLLGGRESPAAMLSRA